MTRQILLSIALCLSVGIVSAIDAGCQRPSEPTRDREDGLPGSAVRIDIDKRNPERLLQFYLGGVSKPDQEALIVRGGKYYVDLNAIRSTSSSVLSDADGNKVIDWDELEPFVVTSYYELRRTPATLIALESRIGDWHSEDWVCIEVQGVMTALARRICLPQSNLQAAITSFELGESLVYPDGTPFVAEHLDGDRVRETTTMIKRGDGFWDFAAYDSSGALSSATLPFPRAYDVPTQCVGCHYGNRAFEPEKSFPASAPPGPTGPRAVVSPRMSVDGKLVSYFDEHRRRTDTVLGLYATLYVASLRSKSPEKLSEKESAILSAIGE